MKWRRSINLIEVAYFVTGLGDTGILRHEHIEGNLIDRLFKKDRRESGYIVYSDSTIGKPNPLIRESNDIFRALIEHATPEDPLKHAPLKIHHKAFAKGVYEPMDSLFTVESLAQWFYEAGDEEKASKLVPNFSPDSKENSTLIISLKRQNTELSQENERLKQEIENHKTSNLNDTLNYPSGINNAIQVFNECWSHLPDDMERPSKDNLTGFIKTELGQKETTTITALLKLSTPDNETYGGKPKKEQTKPWKPKKLN